MTDEMTIDRESETRLEARSTSAQELLHQWLAERRSEGYCPAQIFNATLASGWTREAAVAAMGHVMGDMVTQKELDLLLRGTPEPDLNDSPSSVVVEGREVQILFEMQNPRVVVFGGLLSDDECDQIVEIAWSRVQRSTVMSDEDFDGGVVSDIRTSQGAFLKRGEFDVCNRIDARIEVLLNWPIDCTEDLQVLRYEKGGEYKAHYDFFDTAAGHWTPTLRRGGAPVRHFADIPQYTASRRRHSIPRCAFGGARAQGCCGLLRLQNTRFLEPHTARRFARDRGGEVGGGQMVPSRPASLSENIMTAVRSRHVAVEPGDLGRTVKAREHH